MVKQEQNEVKTSRRISAYLLDIIFIAFLVSLIMQIRIINPKYDKYIETSNKYQQTINDYYDKKIDDEEFVSKTEDYFYNINKYGIVYNIITFGVIIGYFAVFQKYNNGQTLGKKIMKIKVVKEDGNNITLLQAIIRCIPISFLYIGNIIIILYNSIFVFFLNVSNFYKINVMISMIINAITTISLVMIVLGKDKCGLHDKLAKTKVINEAV